MLFAIIAPVFALSLMFALFLQRFIAKDIVYFLATRAKEKNLPVAVFPLGKKRDYIRLPFGGQERGAVYHIGLVRNISYQLSILAAMAFVVVTTLTGGSSDNSIGMAYTVVISGIALSVAIWVGTDYSAETDWRHL